MKRACPIQPLRMLSACPDCGRHRRDETRCPFCDSERSGTPRAVGPKRRAGRAAAFLFGIAAFGACGATSAYGGPPAPPDAGAELDGG